MHGHVLTMSELCVQMALAMIERCVDMMLL